MFHRLWGHRLSKYLGVFGVLLPTTIALYYFYIESWALGYAWQTLTGSYWGRSSQSEMSNLFVSYLGVGDGFFSFGGKAYLFFLIAFAINALVIARGISKGIEVLAKYAMPTLVVLGTILVIRVLTLPPVEGRTVSDALSVMWVIDWSVLTHADIWMAATGQIFFTLSLGYGMIMSFASYLHKKEDITLNGLSTVSTNEFCEVILGGTIAVPAAALFFGLGQVKEVVADSGSAFGIGFFSLPVIFQQIPFGQFFGTLWFLLLFLAGMTSAVAMLTPLLRFLEDELNMKPKQALRWLIPVAFLLMQPAILFYHRGVLDELDYWVANFLVVLSAAIEAVLFAWVFGMEKGWAEMHLGADLRIPGIYYYVMKFVTPIFALTLLAWWFYDSFWKVLTMQDAPPENVPYLWIARAIIAGIAFFLLWGIHHAWKTHPKFFDEVEGEQP